MVPVQPAAMLGFELTTRKDHASDEEQYAPPPDLSYQLEILHKILAATLKPQVPTEGAIFHHPDIPSPVAHLRLVSGAPHPVRIKVNRALDIQM